jgi:hypothetical protein
LEYSRGTVNLEKVLVVNRGANMDAGSKKREIPHPRASANPLSAITF